MIVTNPNVNNGNPFFREITYGAVQEVDRRVRDGENCSAINQVTFGAGDSPQLYFHIHPNAGRCSSGLSLTD